ncbi:hypothetical protein DSL72_004438 [Monilinia vaccinii-corymbosi]|uniref:CBM1 domain-containing protein n=1 Tax=Monilinia vaccinii-corymbosi TaxID=61207 RepID=A0A8A3P0I0_9HELO|nr:hypothetical protein DSL72_004438 [Monilinia vaccinii-corymbosi]
MLLLSVVLFVAAAAAQQSLYGQCGGIGWTGATTCTAGSTCVFQNPYYSQCLPGAASSASSSKTTSAPTTSKTSVTSTAKVSSTSTSVAKTAIHTPRRALTQPHPSPPLVTLLETPTSKVTRPQIGYLVEKYNTTLTLSYNFASGGATTNASLVAPYASTVLSLVDQTNHFVQYIPSGPWSPRNTLFGIWMGINDVGNAYYLANYTILLGQIMDSYFAEVQRLYDAGARNFLFLTVPPTQDSPLFIAQGTAVQASLAHAISQYNAAIASRVAEFQAAHPGSATWVYDTQTPFLAAIKNPTAYGAADATCFNSNGVSCLWWNNYHPGQIIHTLIGQGVAELLKGTFW